jgi:hypothetical protein
VYQQQNLRMSSGAASAEQHAHGGPPPVRQEKELMS